MGIRANTLILIAADAAADLSAPWISREAAEVEVSELGTLINYEANFTPTQRRFEARGPGELARVTDLENELEMLRWLGGIPRGKWLFLREGELDDAAGGWAATPFSDHPIAGPMLASSAEVIKGLLYELA